MGYVLMVVFIVALCLGSFYNVVALRTLKSESVSFPPSHCTSCEHRLGVLDLFPVISWVLLGGKCRYCKAPISKLYPFGELMTAVSYTVVIYMYGFTMGALPHIVLVTVLSMSTITDLKEMVVPDRFILIGVVLNIVLRMVLVENFWAYIVGGVGCFVIFLILAVFGMGGADVKMYGLIGLTVGFVPGVLSLFYASFVGVIYNIKYLVTRKKGDRAEVPFIPFIYAGVILTYLIPIEIILKI